MITQEEYANAIQAFGYSPAESQFIALAALHSGYFVARQFRSKRGAAVDNLCHKVLRKRHGHAQRYVDRTVLYHLTHKAIYRALGEPENRHRREANDSFRKCAKVMGLDFVLEQLQVEGQPYRFLPTEDDKLAYFVGQLGIRKELLPSREYISKDSMEATTRYCLDKFPIRVTTETNEVAFCFVDAVIGSGPSFENWLGQYHPLINAIEQAEVIYVGSKLAPFGIAQRTFAKAFPAASSSVSEDLLAYFIQRRRVESKDLKGLSQQDMDQYHARARRYKAERFEAQYKCWLEVFNGELPKPREVKFSTYQLNYSYGFFGSAIAGREKK